MITAGLIRLSAALLWIVGLIDGSDVTQTPLLWKLKDQSATMNCSHNKDASFYQMYWYRQLPGEGMKQIVYTTTIPPFQYESGFSEDKFPAQKNNPQTGSLTVEKLLPEDSGVYFCAVSQHSDTAYFGQGTKLTVLEKDKEITGPSVKVLQPSPKECKNEKDKQRKKTLVCVAKDFYPDHVSVSWEINGQNVTNGVATDEAAQLMPEKKFYQITSRLRVPAKDWENSDNEFKCIVNFFNKTHTVPYTDSIYGEAVTTTNVMTREKYVKITQAAKLTYSVFIAKSCIYGAFVVFLVWKLQGSKGKQNY
uniref:Ig-like domain-containing protein n=1 Tax=Dicentrarchus labrax TaxID=13489 RepID=A0A8P4FWI0_DICLA